MTRVTALAACASIIIASSCRSSAPSEQSGSQAAAPAALLDTPAPVMAGVEPALQERIRESHRALGASHTAGDAERGRAYGALGKLLLAAELYEQAEPYLTNARTLEPRELAWPYYLAHAHRLRFQSDHAISRFEDVLRLKPDHVPTLVWLGTMHLDAGRPDLADQFLLGAVAVDSRSAAALFQLGRLSLATGDAPRAVKHLEAALAADPSADAVHYALAQAYRTLGDQARAASHLRLWKDERLYPVDPLMAEVTDLLKTAVGFEIRGTQAMDDRKWREAIGLFREGLKVAPRDATLHQNLGAALYLSGDVKGAEAEFEEAARLLPGYAKPLFSLGVILEERGRDQDAIDRFSKAVASDPSMLNARLSLADALRRSGQFERAIAEYAHVVKADPSAAQARFGHAMALVRLTRFADARAVLEEAVRVQADQPGLAHALARVLAAAPDGTVRDGARALSIIESIERSSGSSVPVIETVAMALAETGRFTEAIARQRQAIALVTQAGRPELVKRLTENLRLYESGLRCRTPWTDDDPVHYPRSSRP